VVSSFFAVGIKFQIFHGRFDPVGKEAGKDADYDQDTHNDIENVPVLIQEFSSSSRDSFLLIYHHCRQ